VRPLPFVNEKDEQKITRKHFIRGHPHIDNLFSIVGGKLTTYRSLAEEAVDLVLQELGRSSPKCFTDREPLPGAAVPDFEAFRTDFNGRYGLSEAASDRLSRIYGTRASAVVELISDDPSLGEVFDLETGAIAAELVFAFKHELARTLSDCLLRRTMVGLNSSCGLNAVDAAASIARKYLGWSASRADQEAAAYRRDRKANC
jgi:glycerol-3-phosphate dehydrogenase